MRGVLPGGRYGVLLHELLEDPRRRRRPCRAPSTACARPARSGFWRSIKPDRTDIPILGNFLDGKTQEQTSAFEGQGAWSPVTTAASAGARDRVADRPMVLTVKERTPFINSAQNLDLEPYGVQGWRAAPGADR